MIDAKPFYVEGMVNEAVEAEEKASTAEKPTYEQVMTRMNQIASRIKNGRRKRNKYHLAR